MPQDNSELLARYESGLGSISKTRKLYVRFIRDFLEYAEGDLSREKIMQYMSHLKTTHKYSDGTVNLIFRAIRTMYSRNGIPWLFRHGDSPRIREGNVKVPALHPNKIIQMIEAVKQGDLANEKAFLALSTTYGLRKGEMAELIQKDIRLKDKTIHIATLKHGRERTHIIPPEILPYLKGYNFDTKVTDASLFILWYLLEYRIGLKHIPRVGFHSIRRTINTLLGKKLSDSTVKSFMRHKQRTSQDMTYRYSAVTFVGEEEESVEVVGDALDVDNEVFRVHPFLEFWR